MSSKVNYFKEDNFIEQNSEQKKEVVPTINKNVVLPVNSCWNKGKPTILNVKEDVKEEKKDEKVEVDNNEGKVNKENEIQLNQINYTDILENDDLFFQTFLDLEEYSYLQEWNNGLRYNEFIKMFIR